MPPLAGATLPLHNMPSQKNRVTVVKEFSPEGKVMNAAFKRAARKAVREAFALRKTILVEKDGWLVMINKEGKVVKKIRQLEAVCMPAG